MDALSIALLVFVTATPALAFFVLLRRVGGEETEAARAAPRNAGSAGDAARSLGRRAQWRRLATLAGTMALGALSFIPAWMIEQRLQRWAGLDEHARLASDLPALVYAFLVVAPLEQGLKVAAVGPVSRSRYFEAPIDGILYAAAAAIGFVSAHNVEFLWARPLSGIDVSRALLAVPAHVFFAATWGYALGRDAKQHAPKRLGGRAFNGAWLLAMLFNGVYDHIVFARSPTALIATLPILFAMTFIALIATRDLLRRGAAGAGAPKRRFLPAIAPPSMDEVRAALRRSERPVTLTWIGFGALVTTGVMTASLAGAVVLGHRIGIDFAAVDRGGTAAASAAPLVLLGAASLASFPVAGYLVARASAARTVQEPAISAALAIAGSLVLLGLAAPVAVVFAIAFAPIALGLACVGAWMGLTR